MARLTPTKTVIRELFALSGNRCAFPDCTHPLIDERGNFIAELCHIEGVKGERFNPNQTDEDRRSVGNLVLFCHPHHIVTDNESEYSVDRLKMIKKEHENKFRDNNYKLPPQYAEQILENLTATSARMEGKIDELREKMEELLAKPIIGEEKLYIQQLELIKGLKKQGKHQTVIELLLDYKEKNWDKITPEIRFKLIANIAITYFDLYNKAEAVRYIKKIKDIPFENEESLALQTLGYALAKDYPAFEEYFQKTVARNPENANAWIGYIVVHGEEEDFNEESLPSSLLVIPEVLFNLGELFFGTGNRKKAVEYFRKSLSLQKMAAEKDSDVRSIIASRLISELTDPFKYVHNEYTDEQKQDLKEAIIFFSESWDLIKDTELARSRYYTILNRGVAYKLTRQIDLALADFQKAYELSGDFISFKNLSVLYLEREDYPKAEALIVAQLRKTDLKETERYDLSEMNARILFKQGRIQEL